MRKFFLLFVIFFSSIILSAQQKYFIYFKDKGITRNSSLSKSSEIYASAKALLTERAIERRKRVMGENYITFDDLPINEKYVAKVENLGATIVHKLRWMNAVSAKLNPDQIDKIKSLEFVSDVRLVAALKNYYPVSSKVVGNVQVVPPEKRGGINYGVSFTQLQLSEIPAVHKLGLTGENVIIGLLDTGFKWKNNPAVENVNVMAEHDFVFGDNITENEAEDNKYQHNHGSYVLSIVAAKLEGQLIGPAFNSKFYLAKTEDIRSERNIEEDNYAAGIEWLESMGVDITSSSLGYSEFDSDQHSYTYEDMDGKTTVVAKAAEKAFERGILVISSAGNEGNNSWNYIVSPADGKHVLAAGAVSSNGNVASFSSRGPTPDGRIKPDLMAMGSSTAFAYPNGQVAFGGGTSFSAPILCGISALLKEAYPHLTNNQARAILIESGDRTANPDTAYGYGIASALRAVTFPNIEQTSAKWRLHKIFADTSGILANTISIHYAINSNSYQSTTLTKLDSIRYYYDLYSISDSDSLAFYFTYDDVSGKSFREPASGEYQKSSGSIIVRYNFRESLELPSENSLSLGYPNPFVPSEQYTTNFNILSTSDNRAEVVIYDLLGRKVKTIFQGRVKSGVEIINWDGTNSHGANCASGVYIAEMKLGEELFRRKILLIR